MEHQRRMGLVVRLVVGQEVLLEWRHLTISSDRLLRMLSGEE